MTSNDIKNAVNILIHHSSTLQHNIDVLSAQFHRYGTGITRILAIIENSCSNHGFQQIATLQYNNTVNKYNQSATTSTDIQLLLLSAVLIISVVLRTLLLSLQWLYNQLLVKYDMVPITTKLQQLIYKLEQHKSSIAKSTTESNTSGNIDLLPPISLLTAALHQLYSFSFISSLINIINHHSSNHTVKPLLSPSSTPYRLSSDEPAAIISPKHNPINGHKRSTSGTSSSSRSNQNNGHTSSNGNPQSVT